MGGSALYLGALVAYPLSPHGREVWNRQGQVTLRVANPVVVSTSTSETVSDGSRLLALGLELPEEAFIDMFNFDAQGESYCTWVGWSLEHSSHLHQCSVIHEVVSVKPSKSPKCLMLCTCSFPRSEEDEVKSKNVWMKGHAGKSSSLAHHSKLTEANICFS